MSKQTSTSPCFPFLSLKLQSAVTFRQTCRATEADLLAPGNRARFFSCPELLC